MRAATPQEVAPSAQAVPHIGFGHVWHSRLRPSAHRFEVPTFFLMLPMRALRAQPERASGFRMNRRGWLAFWDRDHGEGMGPEQGGALAWVEGLLKAEGVEDADGEIWLQCYPRVFGYSFKPVSFWYCHRSNGALRAIVVEVNNTFGERHVYLLDQPRYGQPVAVRKCFHVSPFFSVTGHYQFEFHRKQRAGFDDVRVRIDYHDDEGPALLTGVAGRLEPLTPQVARQALWRYPLLMHGVMVRILWHALRLWLKKVAIHAKPKAPINSVSRSSPSKL